MFSWFSDEYMLFQKTPENEVTRVTKRARKYSVGAMLLILFFDFHFPNVVWADDGYLGKDATHTKEEVLLPLEQESIVISSQDNGVSLEIPILIRPLTGTEKRLIAELDPYKKDSDSKEVKKQTRSVSKKADTKQKKSQGALTITAYSSTVDQTDATPCITANGYDVCKNNKEDIIATNMLPFGTKVRIPELYGDRVFTVQDRMHPRFAQRVDVWMKSRGEAKKFGVKHAHIEVVHEELAMNE